MYRWSLSPHFDFQFEEIISLMNEVRNPDYWVYEIKAYVYEINCQYDKALSCYLQINCPRTFSISHLIKDRDQKGPYSHVFDLIETQVIL